MVSGLNFSKSLDTFRIVVQLIDMVDILNLETCLFMIMQGSARNGSKAMKKSS